MGISEAGQKMNDALVCLALAVPENVQQDVKTKVTDYIQELATEREMCALVLEQLYTEWKKYVADDSMNDEQKKLDTNVKEMLKKIWPSEPAEETQE